jgi:hypothetical protein
MVRSGQHGVKVDDLVLSPITDEENEAAVFVLDGVIDQKFHSVVNFPFARHRKGV